MISQEELTFLVHPPEVTFRQYDPFETYQAVISFQNQTHVTQDMKVIPPDSRFFTISAPRGGSRTLKVSAGLSISYTITFKPEEDKDYGVDLVCVTEFHKFVVPIRAISARGTLDVPKKILFEDSPVKYETEKTLYVRNTGRKPAHFNLDVTQPWYVSPSMGALDPGEAMQINVFFTPKTLKKYEGTMNITYSNGDRSTSVLAGSVIEVPVKLQDTALQLQPTFISLERQSVVRVLNRSDVNVHCAWKLHAKEEDSEGVDDGHDLPFTHPVFTIEPISSECKARSVQEFVVTFNPQMAVNYDAIGYLDVVGRRDRLPLHLSGVGKGPRCCFSYDALDLGDIFINSVHMYEVMLENRGSIEARFGLIKQNTLFGPKFTFNPSSGTVQPGESQVIDIRFSSDIIGIIKEGFSCEIKGAKDLVPLHFKGRVIGPTFHFDVDDLDFGHVPFNFVNQKMFHIINTSEIPMKFTLRVPEDGAGDAKEFEIIPSNGVILPHGKQRVTLDFLSNTVQEYNCALVVDIDDVGANLDQLPIRALCMVPDVTISRESLDFGQCFVGYPYKQTVEIKNDSHLPVKYEVLLPQEEDPIRKKFDVEVEAKKGVVNPRCTHKVMVTLTAKQIGSGHLPLYIRMLGSDKPPFPLAVSTRVIGPVVTVEPMVLDFGKANVLEDLNRTIQLTNKSPIPAKFTTQLKSKSPTFSLPVTKGVIPPDSSFSLQVFAFLDEIMKFTEEFVLTVENTGDIAVKLVAYGKGTTVVPSIPLDTVDFGNQFTTTSVAKTFVLSNRGRKPQQIVWVNDRGSKVKEGEPPFAFWIAPERATILPKSEAVFTIEGLSQTVGKFTEKVSCKQQQTHKIIYHPVLTGNFHAPLLKFSASSILFHYSYDKDEPTDVLQSRPLTLKNTSPLVLHFTLKAGAPFTLDQTEYQLGFGESATVNVDFDASYRGDRVSHRHKTKLSVVYKDHPQKDSMELLADVTFPNLALETDTVDFGCVLNETVRKVYLLITNTSKVDARYDWVFEDDGRAPATDGHDSPPSSPLRAGPGSVSPLPAQAANVFDVLPIRGFLRPGESERVEFLYHGHAQRRLKATAVCAVEGGPDYPVQLVGEASSMQFKFDKSVLEFGAQGYDKWDERELFLTNAAKVAFPYAVDLGGCGALGRVDVQPREGVVKGNDRVRFVVRFCPKVPDRVEETFLVRVAHFDAQPIRVTGIGQYSTLHFALPRQHADLYDRFVPGAKDHVAAHTGRKYWMGPEAKPEAPSPVEVDSEAQRLYFIKLLEEHHRLQQLEAAPAPPPSARTRASSAAPSAPVLAITSARSTPRPPGSAAPGSAAPGSAAPGDASDRRQSARSMKSTGKPGTAASVPVSPADLEFVISAQSPTPELEPPKSPRARGSAAPESPSKPPTPAVAVVPPEDDFPAPPTAVSVPATAEEVEPPAPEPPKSEFPVELLKGPAGKDMKLVLSRFVCDFGPIVKGDTRKKTFRITNDSHTTLTFHFDKRVINNSGVTFSQVAVCGGVGWGGVAVLWGVVWWCGGVPKALLPKGTGRDGLAHG